MWGSRSALVIARTVKLLCAGLLLASLTVSLTACNTDGRGMGGCRTSVDERDDELMQAEAQLQGRLAAEKKRAASASGTKEPADGVMESVDRPEGDPIELWKVNNDSAVENGGKPPTVTLDKAHFVTEIVTYHWNGGTGTEAGQITLTSADGKVYGPWKTTLRNKVYWVATPDQDVPAGTYVVTDSDSSTWAQNSGTKGLGMTWASGIPVK